MAHVAALALRCHILAHASARVNCHRLLDDETIIGKLADVLARVRHGDLVDLVRVQPYLVLSATKDRRGQPLLQTKRHHLEQVGELLRDKWIRWLS